MYAFMAQLAAGLLIVLGCFGTCRLPSFTDKFQAKEPLTRIRDIAHRNDLPHDLKKEIKHTIQVIAAVWHGNSSRLLTQDSNAMTQHLLGCSRP